MTSYIAITDAETDPEAPLTSELAKKWRDNPIAITEGATGAPKIRRNAIQDFAVGNTIFYRKDASQSVTVSTDVEMASFNFVQTGVMRVTLEHRNITAQAQTRVVLIRAGVETILVTWTAPYIGAGSANWTARTLDISIIHGDVISIRSSSPSAGQTTETRFIQYKNDGTLIWDTVGGRVE